MHDTVHDVAVLLMDQVAFGLAAKKVSELEQVQRTIGEQLREANEHL